jgi:hypothetical protein
MAGEIDASQNIKTIYSSIGDLILYIAMLFIAALFLMKQIEAIKLKKEPPAEDFL